MASISTVRVSTGRSADYIDWRQPIGVLTPSMDAVLDMFPGACKRTNPCGRLTSSWCSLGSTRRSFFLLHPPQLVPRYNLLLCCPKFCVLQDSTCYLLVWRSHRSAAEDGFPYTTRVVSSANCGNPTNRRSESREMSVDERPTSRLITSHFTCARLRLHGSWNCVYVSVITSQSTFRRTKHLLIWRSH